MVRSELPPRGPVRHLTEEMNGQVGVSSVLGEGSTFWADFPTCEPAAQQADQDFKVKDWLLAAEQGATGIDEGIEDAVGDIEDRSGELVLVVDDLDDMRSLIQNALKKNGYRVVTAPNGRAGVQMARRVRPQLIITDWMMPEMSGPSSSTPSRMMRPSTRYPLSC